MLGGGGGAERECVSDVEAFQWPYACVTHYSRLSTLPDTLVVYHV